MAIQLGVIMDPICEIRFAKDTSLALLLAASARGWELVYMEQADLYIENGVARAKVQPLTVKADPNDWFELGETRDIALDALDVILMRKDPPVDKNFFYTTLVLDRAAEAGVEVINPPHRLRDHNEKLFATRFPDLMPPTLVSADMGRLRDFISMQSEAILKPLDGMGGQSIFRVHRDDANTSVILETLTHGGTQMAMAQKYLPQISDGDKRVLVIEGKPVPYGLARIPMAGESRGNLAAGGTGVGFELSDTELQIAERVGQTLREEKILFAGLDIIGDCLTEINITSPTCVQEISRAFDLDIAGQVIEAIAARLA